ncbi:MAG: glycosyltransferase [Phycisphaerae bacterium]
MTQTVTLPPAIITPPPVVYSTAPALRLSVHGKFLWLGEEPFLIKGVTYGPFRPEADGCEYHTPQQVDRDFAIMAQHGINAVRVYTVPPRWLLDAAQRHGLYVLVGLPWEQHTAFLDNPRTRESIIERVRQGVQTCTGHPALLALAIGNEIPASIVRWYGYRRIERFIKQLYNIAKEVDPGALITYVNYPTTEYLYLPFLDFMAMNVYLESKDQLRKYISRLHNIAGDKPLVLAEIGLDSLSKGDHEQAVTLGWQIRSVFKSGCAGTFLFAWTDEWYRGGSEITGWKFGLTTEDRKPKPALTTVTDAFSKAPFNVEVKWPKVSVVICSYNGARTIRFCLEGVSHLRYPNYEVIVVDDGSTDTLPEIVREYPVKLIQSENKGLSNARNVGLEAATGEIIVYLDDDACPTPYWLHFLVETFRSGKFVGVGGPNIAPPGDADIADAVAHSPGGPIHVLLSDTEAEHIPGCNMAFLTKSLRAVGGFDAQFRIAGDDVDVCWRLQARGWRLGFSPAAVVWHKRRNSLRAYWRQQLNYGKAEAMLERKWPEKYNAFGHIAWHGRLYGRGLWQFLNWGRRRIYHGSWGGALFQSVYHGSPGILMSLAMTPEWYLGVLVLSVMFMVGFYWHPVVLGMLLLAALAATVTQAIIGAMYCRFDEIPRTRGAVLKLRLLTMWCYLMQPVARLRGRLSRGLSPWRMRFPSGLDIPVPREFVIWSETWRSAEDRLTELETFLKQEGVCVQRGGDFDRWDLTFRSGTFGGLRMRLAIEEHGSGRQLVRFRTWPTFPRVILVILFTLVALGLFDLSARSWPGAVPMLLVAGALALRASMDAGAALAVIFKYIRHSRPGECELRNDQ